MNYTSQSIHKMSHQELLSQTKSLVLKERNLHAQIVHHLSEIDSRQLHLKRGFSSLFEYTVKELGYSEGAAYRRIQAMKLCRQVPGTVKKLQEGKLSLSSASQLQTFFEKKAKQDQSQGTLTAKTHSQKILIESTTGQAQNASQSPKWGFSSTEKKDLIQKAEGRSTRDTSKLLSEVDPQLSLPQEKVRPLGQGKVEIRLVVNESCQERLDQLKNLLSHQNPNMGYGDLLSFLSQEAIKKHDPRIKKVRNPISETSTSKPKAECWKGARTDDRPKKTDEKPSTSPQKSEVKPQNPRNSSDQKEDGGGPTSAQKPEVKPQNLRNSSGQKKKPQNLRNSSGQTVEGQLRRRSQR